MASRITGHKGSPQEELIILKKADEPAIVAGIIESAIADAPTKCASNNILPVSCNSESLINADKILSMKEIAQEVS